MTKIKVCAIVHTEYHLLLTIFELLTRYRDREKYDFRIVLKTSVKSKRLKQNIDLSFLNVSHEFWDVNIMLDRKLDFDTSRVVQKFLNQYLDVLILFQEQDPLNALFAGFFSSKGTEVHLYQDGFKPYNPIRGFSFNQTLNNIKQNLWLRRNGFTVPDWFSFVNCKRYGFLKGVNKLFLTFPNAYTNWNNKFVAVIPVAFTETFVQTLKRVFCWDDSLISRNENIIFFMNQPLHDDGSFEVDVLRKLSNKYPDKQIYIKLHPLTSKTKLESYSQLSNVVLMDSLIPAELFISQLKNSIILSVCSTSMFIDNSSCKFYWMDRMAELHIARLQRYNGTNPTNHILSVRELDEIL